MSKISVIVPVYKTEDKLNRCIDSILNQTFTDFELILVDDGSPDNCGKICDEYALKDGRIIVIHKENGGVGEAKNTGIKNATGNYITFIDSDDYVDHDYLETLIKANNNNYDLIVCGVKYVSSDTLQVNEKLDFGGDYIINKEDFNKLIYRLLDLRALNYHVAKLYKLELVRKNGILFTDFRKTGADDTLFNFDFLAKANHLLILNKCIYNYVNYNNSTSHVFSADTFSRRKALDSYLLAKTHEIEILDENMQFVLDKRFVLSSFWSASSFAYCKEIKYKEYKKNFKIIASTERFRNAYETTARVVDYDGGVRYIYNNSPLKFFLYCRRVKECIKGNIYKLMPNFVKRIYRKCFKKKDNQ